jgi:hypothetical protein
MSKLYHENRRGLTVTDTAPHRKSRGARSLWRPLMIDKALWFRQQAAFKKLEQGMREGGLVLLTPFRCGINRYS